MFFQGDTYQLAARADAGLCEQLLQSRLHRCFGEIKPRGDFLIAQPFEHGEQHLAFAIRELFAALLLMRAIHRLHNGLNTPLIDPGFSRDHLADGFAQQRRGAVLEEDAAHSVAQSANRVGIVHSGGYDKNAAGIAGVAGLADKLETVLLAQIVVE